LPREIFSKVSPLLHLLCKITVELIIENLCQSLSPPPIASVAAVASDGGGGSGGGGGGGGGSEQGGFNVLQPPPPSTNESTENRLVVDLLALAQVGTH